MSCVLSQLGLLESPDSKEVAWLRAGGAPKEWRRTSGSDLSQLPSSFPSLAMIITFLSFFAALAPSGSMADDPSWSP